MLFAKEFPKVPETVPKDDIASFCLNNHLVWSRGNGWNTGLLDFMAIIGLYWLSKINLNQKKKDGSSSISCPSVTD